MPLTTLPLLRWARHLDDGTVRVSGHLPEAVDQGGLLVEPGPVRVELLFQGGGEPEVAWVRLAGGVRIDGEEGSERRLEHPERIRVAVGLMDRLADVEVEARMSTRKRLRVDLAEGVGLGVDPEVVVTVSCATRGEAGALQLSRPVVVGFGGEGVRVEHSEWARLSRMADVRLSRLTLHPDGRVRLQGRGARGLNLAVKGGLTTASARVTRLVRRGERFRSLRGFLHLE